MRKRERENRDGELVLETVRKIATETEKESERESDRETQNVRTRVSHRYSQRARQPLTVRERQATCRRQLVWTTDCRQHFLDQRRRQRQGEVTQKCEEHRRENEEKRA